MYYLLWERWYLLNVDKMDTKYDVKEIDIDEEGNEVFFLKIAGTWKCDFCGPLCYDFFWKSFWKTVCPLDSVILHA